MVLPASGPRAPFFPGQDVAIVDIRTSSLEEVLPISAVSPQGDIMVRGWKGRFSADGLEIREPSGKAAAARQHGCAVISLRGAVLSYVPRLPARGRGMRAPRPRWFIRAATAEDRAFLDARDDDLHLMRLVARRLAAAARSGRPMAREALLEVARLVGQPAHPGRCARKAGPAVRDPAPRPIGERSEASACGDGPSSRTALAISCQGSRP